MNTPISRNSNLLRLGLVAAFFSASIVVPATSHAAPLDCDWYAKIYQMVAKARDEGQSRSSVFMILAKNQANESVRDSFLDIVYQVYVPDTVNVKITPDKFYQMAFKQCNDNMQASKIKQ